MGYKKGNSQVVHVDHSAKINELSSQLLEKAIPVKGAGDGVTDDTQEFINALSTSDYVFVPRGKTYLIGDVDLSGKTVIGHGTIKKKSTSKSSFHIKGDGAVISGITFEAESIYEQPHTDIKLGEGAKNIEISNCVFASSIYSAIAAAEDSDIGGVPYTNKVDGIIITNNTFKGIYTRPIFLHSVKHITIESNIIRNCTADAIRLRENAGYCIINSNQFIDVGKTNWADLQTRDAVDVYWSGDTLTITNNMVENVAFTGFDIKGSAPDGSHKTQRVIITNNQIRKARFYGIFIRGSVEEVNGGYPFIDSVIVADNIITECSLDAVSGTGSAARGIMVEGTSKYINIHDNIVTHTYGRGIMIANMNVPASAGVNKSIRVAGNICINNGIEGTTTHSEAGIHIVGVDGLIVTENICENDMEMPNPYQACGIYIRTIDGGFTPSPKTALVNNNICRSNLTRQIYFDSLNERSNYVYSFSNNLQIGNGAVHRSPWQDHRSEFWGSGVPVSGDGIFKKGDVIYNVNPSVLGATGSQYIITGWKRISDDGSNAELNVDWVEMRSYTGT